VTDVDAPLREEDVDPDPLRQFELWFAAAADAGTRAPEAAVLATATPDGVPAARYVLVKQIDRDGFVFYTNYEGRKGRELSANPRAALLFHWELLGRQVRIEGPVTRTSREQSLAYAHSRPRGSQLSALASPQSRPIESRTWMEERVRQLAQQYEAHEVPLSDAWGGFRLAPNRFEFWQHRTNRLHDRLVYTLQDAANWRIERLAP
jgi:pyridoxamine 5'-phosphate oxidase